MHTTLLHQNVFINAFTYSQQGLIDGQTVSTGETHAAHHGGHLLVCVKQSMQTGPEKRNTQTN